MDLVYDERSEDLPEKPDGEIVSLIDNDGIEVKYDQASGKQIEAQGNPGESAIKKFAELFGKIDPLKRFGASRTKVEEENTELVNSYNSTLKPSEAVLGAAASASLMAGPPESSWFYETFNNGLPEDILIGIGAVAGTGFISAQRYESGKREKLSEEIRQRRAEELVERFGEYRITAQD